MVRFWKDCEDSATAADVRASTTACGGKTEVLVGTGDIGVDEGKR